MVLIALSPTRQEVIGCTLEMDSDTELADGSFTTNRLQDHLVADSKMVSTRTHRERCAYASGQSAKHCPKDPPIRRKHHGT